MKTVNILGVNIACINAQGILDLLRVWIEQGHHRTIFYVNAHCLNTAVGDRAYHTILNNADLVYADGISIVWAGYVLDGSRMYKATGADWIEQFCDLAEAHAWRIYILAGQPGIARRACDNLTSKRPALRIVGAYDGFFIEKSEADILHDIVNAAPHVLFVGMGTPRQEKWIATYRETIPVSVCWSVGALFDYAAGIEPRVPTWMNILALEWFWRLLIDPVGKWQRYLLGNPLFLWRVCKQRLGLLRFD